MSSSAAEFNRALYDEFWDACPDFSRYNPGALHRRRGIAKLLRETSFRSLLDVGCGDGQLLLWLRSWAPEGAELVGADLSPDTVEANTKQHKFASFSVLDVQREALDRTFDVVVCTEVLEHLDHQREALKNLASMVAPGGHLILTCPTGKVHATEKHFGHVSHPRPAELETGLREAGLEVVRLENWGFPLYGALKTATNVNPDWALRNFASGKYTLKARLVSRALYLANFFNVPSSPWGVQLFVLARKPR